MKKEFSAGEERAIIDYYKTHSDNNTAKFFHTHFCRIEKILRAHGIDRHSKEENAILWKQSQKDNTLKKYGVSHHLQAESVKEKRKQTNLKKYGAENVFAAESVKTKIKANNLEKYGVANYSSTKECREKVKQANIEKHGKINVGQFGTAEHSKAMMKKYGVEWFSQTSDWVRKARKRYVADSVSFDSLPELAFYLWHKEKGIKIRRAPEKFEYEFEGETHYYFPDFEIGGKLYEIKGS